MSTSRRYTDDEVHAIFERAAARQEEATHAEEASRAGLSLEELKEIGAEAGIDSAHIALAANELAVRGAAAETKADESLLGIPTRIGATRVIRGHVTHDEWERMVVELRGIFGRDGISGEIGRVREWTAASSVGKSDRATKVTLTPEGDDTLVTINQEMRGQAVGFSIGTGAYLLVAVLMGVVNLLGTGADKPPIGVAILFLLMAVAFFGVAQFGTRAYARKQRGKFESALDRMELVARESQHLMHDHGATTETPIAKPVGQESRTPEIDLDALSEPEDFGSQRDPSERTRS